MQMINLKGKDYPILFDLNVIEQIQKRYGDITKLDKKMQDISEQKWILTQIINEGIEFDNFEHNRSNKTLTEKQVGMLLGIKELQSNQLAQTIVNAFNDCLGDEKNLTAEQIMEKTQTMTQQ